MDRSEALKHLNITFAALGDLTRHPARSVVVTGCLVAALLPYMISVGTSEGLRFQSEISLKEGADFYVSSDQYGANGPLRIEEIVKELSALNGVRSVRTRVVGRTFFADHLVAVVGLDRDALGQLVAMVQGKVPQAHGDVIVSQVLADVFGVKPGIPFTLAAHKRKVFRCSGTLSPSCLWSSHLLVMHLDDANDFFRMGGQATHALVYLSPKSRNDQPASVTERLAPVRSIPAQFRVEARGEGGRRLDRAYGPAGGTCSILLVIGLSLAVPTFVVTSGFGVAVLRKEIGVMRATGWSKRDLIEKAVVENLAISLSAASLATLLAMAWMKGLNGALIAQFLISEVGLIPTVDVPYRISAADALFGLCWALGVTQGGGIISAWVRARTLPAQSVR